MKLIRLYFNLNKYYVFLFIIFINLLILWLSKSLLISETVVYNTYSEQLSYERFRVFFDHLQSISWIGYIYVPLMLLFKMVAVTSVIYTGLFFFDLHEKVKFRDVLSIIVGCEIIFLVANLVKLIWFCFFAGNYDLNDISFYYPLSLSNLFEYSEVDKVWTYPLQILNLFHLLYILLIALGLSQRAGIKKAIAEKIVLVSYLPGLIVWITLVMFLTINDTIS